MKIIQIMQVTEKTGGVYFSDGEVYVRNVVAYALVEDKRKQRILPCVAQEGEIVPVSDFKAVITQDVPEEFMEELQAEAMLENTVPEAKA